MTSRVIFFINKETHILDLAGAVQTFYESDHSYCLSNLSC